MKDYYNYNKVVEEENIEVLLVSRVSLNARICAFHLADYYDNRSKLLQKKIEEIHEYDRKNRCISWGTVMTREEILFVFDKDSNLCCRDIELDKSSSKQICSKPKIKELKIKN